MSTRNLIKLGERLVNKYDNLKLAEGNTSTEAVKQIIIDASQNFIVKGKSLMEALNEDNIYINVKLYWDRGWFKSELMVSDFIFNPSVPEEVQSKYINANKQMKSYFKSRGAQLGISGGPWVITLP